MLSVLQKEMVQITTALKSAGTKDREGVAMSKLLLFIVIKGYKGFYYLLFVVQYIHNICKAS